MQANLNNSMVFIDVMIILLFPTSPQIITKQIIQRSEHEFYSINYSFIFSHSDTIGKQ